MRFDVEKIRFEDNMDLVDYVSKGLPPKSEDASTFLNAVEGFSDVRIKLPKQMNLTQEEFAEVLDRVDRNNRYNHRRFLVVLIASCAITAGVTASICSAGNNCED